MESPLLLEEQVARQAAKEQFRKWEIFRKFHGGKSLGRFSGRRGIRTPGFCTKWLMFIGGGIFLPRSRRTGSGLQRNQKLSKEWHRLFTIFCLILVIGGPKH